jgi:hypothetical protein
VTDEQLVDQAAGCWGGRVQHPLGATISTTICIACLHQPDCMSRKAGDLRFPEPLMTVRPCEIVVARTQRTELGRAWIAPRCSAKADIGASGSSMQGNPLLALLCFAKP